MADLSGAELDELRKLLEEENVIEPPTIVFTVRHIGSDKPPRVLRTGMYSSWYQGREWWDSLPIAKRRELVAEEHAAQSKR